MVKAGRCQLRYYFLVWPTAHGDDRATSTSPLSEASRALKRVFEPAVLVATSVERKLIRKKPMAQCSGYNGYRKIARSSNVERGCCLDE
ncbi:hypothetical protein J6590_052109 [Homalodisca vitripennis]|nr:hypothetical protein J6590_052109 [Homalodisca vitripennis]